MALTSRERVIRTFDGKGLDRVATYDIMRNTALMGHLAGQKINSKNAEDVVCKAVGKALDMIRHFAVPDIVEPVIERDEGGFVHKKE